MSHLKRAGWLIFSSLLIVCLMLVQTGSAQLSVRIQVPGGQWVDATGRNAPRGDEALILYDQAYGKSTRTNPYGVEVIAVPAEQQPAPDGQAYRVTGVTSVWECQRLGTPAACGNAEIPANGIVLSATGGKRDWLKTLQAGDLLTLQEDWFQRKQAQVNGINPSPENNPAGSGFPGYRASNQLLVYDAAYGQPTTGTNEFGFEVTVRDGIVTDQEGSDSTIPPDGYVVSGHGRARSWLIANAPVGARMELDPINRTLAATIDFDTYAYQFDRRWAESPCAGGARSSETDNVCAVIREQRADAVLLALQGRDSLAAAKLSGALESLNRRVWQAYQAFPADTVRGAWHRPVEKSAAAIGRTLDSLKAAGLNAVFLETFFHGYTIFPSETFRAYGLPVQNPKFEGIDLLKTWVDEAHKRDMQVHTWFQTFYGGTKAYNPPGPILAKYPEWANVQYSALVAVDEHGRPVKPDAKPAPGKKEDKPVVARMMAPKQPVSSTLELGGYFLDPANPEVKTFLRKLAEEIVTRYDIDGFQLDYIRYPASFPSDRFSFRKTTWGYTDVARNLFKARYGADPAQLDPKDPMVTELWKAWADFKTGQVNEFVEQTVKALRAQKPDVQISAAIFPEAENALLLKHQDWRTWAQNGWIDFYAPMTLTSAVKVVERDTRVMVDATNGRLPIYSGIFGPFNDNTAEHVLTQIDAARRAGAKGFVLFDTAHLSARMLEALKAMQATPPPVVTPAVAQPLPPAKPAKPAKKKRWWQRG